MLKMRCCLYKPRRLSITVAPCDITFSMRRPKTHSGLLGFPPPPITNEVAPHPQHTRRDEQHRRNHRRDVERPSEKPPHARIVPEGPWSRPMGIPRASMSRWGKSAVRL